MIQSAGNTLGAAIEHALEDDDAITPDETPALKSAVDDSFEQSAVPAEAYDQLLGTIKEQLDASSDEGTREQLDAVEEYVDTAYWGDEETDHVDLWTLGEKAGRAFVRGEFPALKLDEILDHAQEGLDSRTDGLPVELEATGPMRFVTFRPVALSEVQWGRPRDGFVVTAGVELHDAENDTSWAYTADFLIHDGKVSLFDTALDNDSVIR